MKKCFWGTIFATFTLIGSTFAQIDVQGDVRFKIDSWQWFRTPGYDDEYTIYSNLMRVRFTGAMNPKMNWLLEIGQAAVGGLPNNANAPSPQGGLGPGATFKSVNGDNKSSLFIKQAHIDWNINSWHLRVGRTDFTDGTEANMKDANLAWVRQNRIAQRLLGRNGDSLTQRMYDGILLQQRSGRNAYTLFLVHPVQGSNELDVTHALTRVNVGYFAYTQVNENARQSNALRVLGQYYQDTRPIAKADNSGGLSGVGDINIYTLGADWTQVWKNSSGKTDLLLRAAIQTGDWGQHDHSAFTYALEAGHQFPQGWKPWLRAGFVSGSGDKNATDNKHETYFPGLPGGRIVAGTPFYNQMNLDDAFFSVMVFPAPKWNLRVEFHHLRTNRGSDLWYSGTGAFNNSSFGVSGRPTNSNRELAQVVDLNLNYKFNDRLQLNVYKSWVKGGNLVRSIYSGDFMSLLLVETTWMF